MRYIPLGNERSVLSCAHDVIVSHVPLVHTCDAQSRSLPHGAPSRQIGEHAGVKHTPMALHSRDPQSPSAPQEAVGRHVGEQGGGTHTKAEQLPDPQSPSTPQGEPLPHSGEQDGVPHTPATQDCPGAHPTPTSEPVHDPAAPQYSGLVIGSMHTPLHMTSDAVQGQTPLTQGVRLGHWTPGDPESPAPHAPVAPQNRLFDMGSTHPPNSDPPARQVTHVVGQQLPPTQGTPASHA
jgi:hypothetical protein